MMGSVHVVRWTDPTRGTYDASNIDGEGSISTWRRLT